MKPASMTNREWFIKNIAVNNNVAEKIVLAIINHQFQSLSTSMQTCDTLEVSGFGKFIFNRSKAIKKLASLEHTKATYIETLSNPETTALRHKNAQVRFEHIEGSIANLKNKIYGTK